MSPKSLDLESIAERIRSFYREQSRMPSFSELGRLLGYQSKGGVRYVVGRLIEAEFMQQDMTGRLIPHRRLNSIPLLGSVQAGFPSPAEEELIDTISFDDYIVDNPHSTFIVKVSGDSMIDAGIMPGDMAVIDRGRPAHSGDVVVAEVDGEWTMKFLERKKGQPVRLLPANDKYPPIIAEDELKIGGVVTAVVRKYG